MWDYPQLDGILCILKLTISPKNILKYSDRTLQGLNNKKSIRYVLLSFCGFLMHYDITADVMLFSATFRPLWFSNVRHFLLGQRE